jgi:hypothetical protein
MKKNNRAQYLKTWLTYLKGKNQIDPKSLADFLGKTLKRALAPITMKRYTATVIANLYENGFLAGKTGKTFSGEPLEIVQEITLPVLDKCLTSNYKKIKFTEAGQVAEPVEQVAKPPAAKKPRKMSAKKKAALKPVKAKVGKPAGRKPGPQKKKIAEKPKQAIIVKAKRAPGKTPERKPGKKAAAMVPAVIGKKPAGRKPGLIGRKTDLLKMGEGAFLFAISQQDQIEEMRRVIANYEKVFEVVRQLFSREMEEIEEFVAGLLG